MSALDRNYQKLKTLSDFRVIDAPAVVSDLSQPESCPHQEQMILRMLVRPKYSGGFYIPPELEWLRDTIMEVSEYDRKLTGIRDSWCYVTVRHGPVITETDDEWHFDGASFRTTLIPERNYVWVSHTGPEYKTGSVTYPDSFDPNRHNLFSFASDALEDQPVQVAPEREWLLMNPFSLHRRNPKTQGQYRTFIRISFPDIEGRDVMNTPNPLLDTPAFGRNPVQDFRNKLSHWS